jgi:hypothetical protein
MAQENHAGLDRRRFLAGAAATVGGAAIAGLALPATAAHADSVTGAVRVGARDPQYPDLIFGLNNRWTATPSSVYVVDAPEQVAPIVQSAVNSGSRLTVRSGGHCFEDFVYNSDIDTVLDLSNMNRIYYDSSLNGIAVESGAILLDVYEKLYQTWGVIVPGGVCYSVGMGGHVAGGGWGWLVRRNGLIIDHLYAVEVVIVDAAGKARTVIATREQSDPNRALWWAHTGGGGGNFGIVTRYIFRSPGATGTDPRGLLPRPPAKVLASFTLWSWNDMDEASFNRLMLNYANYHVANKSSTSPTRNLVGLIQMFHTSGGHIDMYAAVDAAAPNAQQLLDDYLAYISDGVSAPLVSAQTTTPWLQFARQTGTTNVLNNDPTLRGEFKSAYFKAAFQAAQLAALYKAMTRADITNPNLNVLISPYGGMTNAVAASATAMPHRDAAFKLLWQAQWKDPADDAVNIGWARQSFQETFADTGGVPVPNDVTDGCYVNYADADLSDPAFNQSSSTWHDLYYKDNYRRLQRVKKAYDPRNFFRHRQSVQPPS